MIVVSSERSRVIDYNDVYTYSYDYSSYSRSIDGYDAEGQLTSAIQYVTMDSTELPVIYQVSGHGETALSGGFTEAIEKANITLSDLALLKEDAVPEDAAALIINGPTTDFSEDDANKVIVLYQSGWKSADHRANFQAQGLEKLSESNPDQPAEWSVFPALSWKMINPIITDNTPYYLLPDVNSSAYNKFRQRFIYLRSIQRGNYLWRRYR